MFNTLMEFWKQIYSVFFPNGGHVYFSIRSNWNLDSVSFSRQGFVTIYSTPACSILTWLSLTGLCVFLFYQIWKVIHAFVGGFYEDAI